MPGRSRTPAASSPAPAPASSGPMPSASGSNAMAVAAVDSGAHDAAASAMSDAPATGRASGSADLVPLYAGTVDQLRANFDAACAAAPDLIVRWEDILPAVTAFVNESHKAGADEDGRKAAARQLATILSTLPRKPAPATDATAPAAATTDAQGALPTGDGFGTGTDQGQLWSGGDPMKQAAMGSGDALESTFGGLLLDGVTLQLADGTKPQTWAIWDSMSAIFAAGMTGEVSINMLFGLRPGSVFERVESLELRKLMDGPAPLVTGIKVKRFLREAKGNSPDGKPYTTATSGAVLHEEKDCPSVDDALNAEPYRWDRSALSNPFFAVIGGHTTGAPPAFDAAAAGAAEEATNWGYRKGLEGSGLAPEW